jgi:tRNA threonylcarbamoyl adenosine modification protein (Sua5/YciO/YrdC/YwlC family)
MSQFFQIHPEKPQARLIQQVVEIVRGGGILVYPTDSCYALGCQVGDKAALERICRIRRLPPKHNFTLICRDLSESSTYAEFNTRTYRLLKAHTPGPYTFILVATREVPRRLMHPKRKTIGMRVPDNRIAQDLLAALDAPMLTTSMILPGETMPMTDPHEIRERLEHEIDLVIDGGPCGAEPTTLVDLTGSQPEILRLGLGDPAPFE